MATTNPRRTDLYPMNRGRLPTLTACGQPLLRSRGGPAVTTAYVPPTPRPYWLLPDLDLALLPEGLRVAITEIVTPAYRELVLEAPTALERAAGSTFAYLLYLELLEQFDLGHTIPGTAVNGQVVNRQAALDRLLRLVSAKQKAASFLQRVKEWRARPRDPLRGLGLPGGGIGLFGKC